MTVKFLTGFGQRPQHLLGGIGLVCFFLGTVVITYLTGYWIVARILGHDPELHNRPALIYSIGAILFGAQLMSIGFLAELITAYTGREADTYSILETAGTPDAESADEPEREHHDTPA